MNNLEELRKRINVINDEMIALFKERMEIVKSIAQYKIENHLPVLDRKRELDILNNYTEKEEDEAVKKDIHDFLENIMFISRRSQDKLKNAAFSAPASAAPKTSDSKAGGYLGMEGSFSHRAFKTYFGENTPGIPFKSFEDIFVALEGDNISFAILPIENSSTGAINDIYDLLQKYGFYITGEKCIKIDQNLLGTQDSSIEDIDVVYSHPQGIAQCREFLKAHPNIKASSCESTSMAAVSVKESQDKHTGCIAGADAASLYGLKVLSPNISSSCNYTRFISISKTKKPCAYADKISIVVSLMHSPGSLYKVMKCFDDNNLNMLKIESRPVPGHPFEYNFFIDFAGTLDTPEVNVALEDIKKNCMNMRVLGNYRGEVSC